MILKNDFDPLMSMNTYYKAHKKIIMAYVIKSKNLAGKTSHLASFSKNSMIFVCSMKEDLD